jgi:hypothetical protein
MASCALTVLFDFVNTLKMENRENTKNAPTIANNTTNIIILTTNKKS